MRLLPRSLISVPLAAALLAVPGTAQVQWTPPADGFPRTAAEMNGFTAHTRHVEMWDYLEELSGATSEMYLGTYGETRQGRRLLRRLTTTASESSA